MNLTLEQEKRFDTVFPEVGLVPREIPLKETIDYGSNLKTFLASELQLERERVLTALRESANVFFREHDLKPCDCLMRYVERRLSS
jgi:hypothetical protein